MRPETSTSLLLSGTALAVVMLGFLTSQVYTLRTEIVYPRQEPSVQKLTETVTTNSGRSIVVETVRNTSPSLESVDDWIARHNAAVTAAKEL